MRFIDATWDTRSLGIPCAELVFDVSDEESSIDEAESLCAEYSYVAAKVPSGKTDLSLQLQSHGFTYIETSIELTIQLNSVTVPPVIARIEPLITSRVADDDGVNRILSKVDAGVFNTDRIFLDPHFSHAVAARRYVNWMIDEIEQGSMLYHVIYQEKEIGFFGYKERIPCIEAYPFLAGMYDEWLTSGLGANAVGLVPIREAQKHGCKRIRTYVSSNNLPVLRLHEILGYRISGLSDVFVRHGN